MSERFDYFVVFAEMRTGSNFLEANLNALDGVTCHGEAFNPHFIGYPNTSDILGIDQTARDANPQQLLAAIKQAKGEIAGFRYFHDHDPRVLEPILDDPRCAKIILTRNPAESYVSWKIAQATGQWKLTDVKRRKDSKAVFDAEEFASHVEALQAFQVSLLNRLQKSGQTAFYVAYEDLQDVDVMNGIAAYLGTSSRLDGLDKSLKVQNPSALENKVENFADMQSALAGVDRFNLTRTPNFEPRRGPVVPSYIACQQVPLIYLPIKGGPEDAVSSWMAKLDGSQVDDLLRKMSQKELRQWKRGHPGHRSFTVLRHPVARAHHVFCKYVLSTGPTSYAQIRQTLIKRYNLPIPREAVDSGYSVEDHKLAFAAFLQFLKGNLNGQTAIRVDAAWCTQSQALQGFGEFVLPDLVLREDQLQGELHRLAERVGVENPDTVPHSVPDQPFDLSAIYNDEIEALSQSAYQRDYMMFGFGAWNAG